MTIKERLKELKLIDKTITSKIRQMEDLRVSAENVGSFELKTDSVSGGPIKDYSGVIDKLIDMSKEINADIDDLVERKRFWRERFDMLPTEQKNVVERYYFENMTWEHVCFDIGYSWRQVHRFHSMALRNLEKMA